jgi:hypothetical protein
MDSKLKCVFEMPEDAPPSAPMYLLEPNPGDVKKRNAVSVSKKSFFNKKEDVVMYLNSCSEDL